MIDLRGRPRLGDGTSVVYAQVRELVPETGEHDPPPDAELLLELVRAGLWTGADE